jgi:hypothetical protein
MAVSCLPSGESTGLASAFMFFPLCCSCCLTDAQHSLELLSLHRSSNHNGLGQGSHQRVYLASVTGV